MHGLLDAHGVSYICTSKSENLSDKKTVMVYQKADRHDSSLFSFINEDARTFFLQSDKFTVQREADKFTISGRLSRYHVYANFVAEFKENLDHDGAFASLTFIDRLDTRLSPLEYECEIRKN